MSIRHNQTEAGQRYFCTFTCLNWQHLFEITKVYDCMYKFFAVVTGKGHHIEGFVMMPSHLHVLLYIGNNDTTVNRLMANGKRFLAYEIVKRLEMTGNVNLLKQLSDAVMAKEKNRKKKHRVCEVSSDIKPCYYESYLFQKLNDFHSNPLRGKWNLATAPE